MSNNSQSAVSNLTVEQEQLIISGILGDGCLIFNNTSAQTAEISFSSIFEEYIEYKFNILKNLSSGVKKGINRGYKENIIYKLRSYRNKDIYKIGIMSIEELLSKINDLGIALWFYDDGSKHKKNNFYNLNTHAFSEEVHRKYFIPFFNSKNIYPTIAYDRKKDGRIFTYLRINKTKGSDKISEILSKYPINCFNYKIWNSEAIQKWSKTQESLKNENIELSI